MLGKLCKSVWHGTINQMDFLVYIHIWELQPWKENWIELRRGFLHHPLSLWIRKVPNEEIDFVHPADRGKRPQTTTTTNTGHLMELIYGHRVAIKTDRHRERDTTISGTYCSCFCCFCWCYVTRQLANIRLNGRMLMMGRPGHYDDGWENSSRSFVRMQHHL